MYHHLLVFTDNERARLKKSYYGLMQKLEAGAAIEKYSLGDMAEIMRVILQSQQALQPFWQQVQQNPSGYYQLHLSHDDKDLLNLPWQLAIDTKQFPFISISKGLTAVTPAAYIPQPGPLRILVMIASPVDQEYSKRLSYEEEEQAIVKALYPLLTTGQVQLHFTNDGSLFSLQQKIQQQHYHIVYFSGHGIYKHDTGYLQVENPVTHKREEVKAQQLASVLKEVEANTPALVILSGCQTAQGSMKEGFRGVADALIHGGIPSVVAMAFNVIDQFTIAFVGHLYEQLADKRPLPEAFSKALHDLQMQEAQAEKYVNAQWIIPQLYLSRPVHHIVDWQQQREQRLNSTIIKFIENSITHETNYRFTGRRRECAALFNELVNNKPVLITGQGGIGKTCLASYLLKRLTMQEPSQYGFVFTAAAAGFEAMETQLLQFLKTTGPQYHSSYENREEKTITQHLDFLIKRVTSFCKPVWIIDDLENYQQHIGGPLKQEYAAWVQYIRENLFNRHPVIVIGRYNLPGLETIFRLHLNELPYTDFYSRFRQLELSTLHTNLQLPDPVNIAYLFYTMFGGHLRILEFLNTHYVNHTAQTLALLQEIYTLNDKREPAKALMQHVYSLMNNSGKQLSVAQLMALLTIEEQKTLHLLLYFDRPVTALALEMQQANKNFTADLQRLNDLTLVEEHTHPATSDKLYYIAPLVKNSVDGHDLPQVYFYPEHAGDYFLLSADEITLSFDDPEVALRYFKMCRHLDRLNATGVALTNKYYRFGLYDKVLHYGKLVEETAADKTDGDILNNMGLAYLKFGNAAKALSYFTRFSIASRMERDNKNLAISYNAISQAYVQLKDNDSAMEWLQKCIQLAQTGNYKEEEALALSNTGMLYCELGDYDKAMKAFEQSLQIRKTINDRVGQVNVLNNMCRIYGDRGENVKHKATLQQALSIAVEDGNNHLQGAILNNIGFVTMEEGSYEAAIVCFQKNLAVSETINDEEEMGKALVGMGLAYKKLGKHNEAIDYIGKGVLFLQKFDYPGIQTEALYHLGEIYIQRGDAADALPLLHSALSNYRQANKSREVAQTLYHIGDAYLYIDDIDNAIKYLEECLLVLEEVDDIETECLAIRRASQSWAVKGDADKVLDYEERFLDIQRSLGNSSGEAATLLNIATAYLEKGLPELYLYYALEAYSIHSKTNDLHGLYYTSTVLGTFLCVHYPQKYFQQGVWVLEQAYEIGIQSSAFPGVERVADMIENFKRPPGKRKRFVPGQTRKKKK